MYATLDELTERVDWELDADERRIAASALQDASDLAAFHGREWPVSAVPRLVKTLVLKAVKRYMDNPAGYTQSRAGDETLAWGDAHGRDAGSVYFTREEIRLLEELAGRRPGLASVPVMAWGTVLGSAVGTGRVPVEGPGSSFPFFSDDRGPW
ncbi:hypothetical protein [Streptomyces sp. NPDC091278]|uniref:hypothetical protein n=1 Tax=Streptomyces sp. NPDC091278 TaxID=3155301 RepID=UPI00344BFD0C